MCRFILSQPLSCCIPWDIISQLMFISFHLTGIYDRHPTTVLPNRREEKTRKGTRKGKEPLLDLHNKIKIILLGDETFDLWKELIIKYSQEELLDVDTTPICKMRLNLKRTPHRDGILSREFFKWLGNCDEEDHNKLILHILGRSGESRILGYPKVIVK